MYIENFFVLCKYSLTITMRIIDGTSVFPQSNMAKSIGLISQKRSLLKLRVENCRLNKIECRINGSWTQMGLRKEINLPYFKFNASL